MVIIISIGFQLAVGMNAGDEAVAEEADESTDQVEHRVVGMRAGYGLLQTEAGGE